MAEDRHSSHDRALLNHLRDSMKRESAAMEHHQLANGDTKKMQPLLLLAIALLSIIVVSLHAAGGMVLLRTGLRAFSLHNPVAYVLIGLSLVVIGFKLKRVVGVIRRKKK